MDACTELKIEFDNGIILYSQIDSETDFRTRVSFYVRPYSCSEIIIYFCSEINSETNKQLFIYASIGLGLYG